MVFISENACKVWTVLVGSVVPIAVNACPKT